MKIVLVEWIDANGGVVTGWRDLSDLTRREGALAVSMGRVIKETAKELVILPHWIPEGKTLDSEVHQGDGEIAIQKNWIKKIHKLNCS